MFYIDFCPNNHPENVHLNWKRLGFVILLNVHPHQHEYKDLYRLFTYIYMLSTKYNGDMFSSKGI